MSHKYAPPFCNLSLSTKHREGLYAGCDIFSCDYAPPPPIPPNPEMLSGSVDADFVLALPFHHGDLEPDWVRVSTREGSGCHRTAKRDGKEMLPMLVRWRASALRGEEAGRFREVAGVSIVAAGGPRSR